MDFRGFLEGHDISWDRVIDFIFGMMSQGEKKFTVGTLM